MSKGNVLNYSMVFQNQIFAEVSREHSDVKTVSYLIGATSMMVVKRPEAFEVVVTSSLSGDTLTDLGAVIVGGVDLAAGASINPERKYPSMFEPIHGSTPDTAGCQIINPFVTVWAASQMLDFFHHEDWDKQLLGVMEDVLTEGKVLTPGTGRTAITAQVGDMIVSHLSR